MCGRHMKEEIRQPLSQSSPSTVSLDKGQTTGATRTQIHWARKTSRKSSLYMKVRHPGSSPGPAMRTWKQVTKLLWGSSKVERKMMAYFLYKVVRKKKEGEDETGCRNALKGQNGNHVQALLTVWAIAGRHWSGQQES